MISCCSILILSFILDIVLGDPEYALHPTRLIGKLANISEKIFESAGMFDVAGGILFGVFVVAASVVVYLAVRYLLVLISPFTGYAFDIFILYSAIAFKDMFDHADRVYERLKKDNIMAAKEELKMIVGRDVSKLDITGIVMATIESMSENFVDGFLSVVFWYCMGVFLGDALNLNGAVFGVACALAYRAINTLDSMVGYRSIRYLKFGKFAARFDDFANFIPARLSAVFICFSACFVGGDCISCIKTFKEDRLQHPSVNSAHAESAISGALQIRLGGETVYSYARVKKPFIGEHYRLPSPDHIKKCFTVLFVCAVSIVMFAEIVCCVGLLESL